MSVERWAVCDVCGKRERHDEAAFSIYPDGPMGWVAVSFVERGGGPGDHAIVCSRVCAIAFADRLGQKWGVTAEELEAAEKLAAEVEAERGSV